MISAQNPFGPTGNDTYTHTSTPNYTRVVQSWHSTTRGFSIRVSWRFGSLKAIVRKANRTISNDDVVGGATKNKANPEAKFISLFKS